MSENCTHNCSSCGENCSSRAGGDSLIKPLHENASVRKVIAVVSGKGGVGKSMTTAMLAAYANRQGYTAAILDADITGPSIPKLFDVHERATGYEGGIFPVLSKSGIQMMSMNVLLDEETQPVVWRGSLIAGTVTQFWTDVVWQDVDYMFVDMPPGTGDVPLTIFQSLPLAGIVIVTTPQDLVSMIVEKAVNMAKMMNVPILGIVENMSYFACPDCGKKHEIFGKSRVEELARAFEIPSFARMPVDPVAAEKADLGKVEEIDPSPLLPVFAEIEKA
ncbi:MAG: Mrp/NBP35 family ATP-binding protein [Clostridia bacterium]|nr:Mrp/NBP35 family ATP-binding protein [Clostridia bacterium]